MPTLEPIPTALLLLFPLFAQEGEEKPPLPTFPDPPAGRPPVLAVERADAASPEEMQRYTERIPGTAVTFEMVPLPGGVFEMGSPEDEWKRGGSEGPVHEVLLDPFWIEVHEATWDEFEVFQQRLDVLTRERGEGEKTEQDPWADAVSRPTPPYVPMDFGMGTKGFPAISMTQFAAKQYTKWLSMKTGRFYRLPTEAEWEYACRGGTRTAYSWGDDPDDFEEYAWCYENAEAYHPVMQKKPNPFGLFDMHGNVSEWVLDGWEMDSYDREGPVKNPLLWPEDLYPRVVRGGSWDDDLEDLRSAARHRSKASWQQEDPQLPKSIWYHTNAKGVGFRVVRPLVVPPPQEQARYWEADLEMIAEIQARQRKGER